MYVLTQPASALLAARVNPRGQERTRRLCQYMWQFARFGRVTIHVSMTNMGTINLWPVTKAPGFYQYK